MTGLKDKDPWTTYKEKILLFFGLLLITASFVVTEIFGGPFHFEFLIAGLACAGISIATWGDRGK